MRKPAMTMRYVALCASAVLAAIALQATPAQALTMAECSAKYKAAKDGNTLNGMKWNDFRKANCGSDATATPAAAPAPAPAPTPKPTVASAPPATPAATEAKPASAGRQAMYARERACGAEWKAAKANGTRPAGMKWPQFW